MCFRSLNEPSSLVPSHHIKSGVVWFQLTPSHVTSPLMSVRWVPRERSGSRIPCLVELKSSRSACTRLSQRHVMFMVTENPSCWYKVLQTLLVIVLGRARDCVVFTSPTPLLFLRDKSSFPTFTHYCRVKHQASYLIWWGILPPPRQSCVLCPLSWHQSLPTTVPPKVTRGTATEVGSGACVLPSGSRLVSCVREEKKKQVTGTQCILIQYCLVHGISLLASFKLYTRTSLRFCYWISPVWETGAKEEKRQDRDRIDRGV